MIGENQLLLNILVSISFSSLSYPARLGYGRLIQPAVPYSSPFEIDFWASRTLLSASDMSFLA